MEIISFIWLAVLIFFIVVEALTASLVSLWFCIGAVCAFGASLLWPDVYFVQIIIFLVVSLASLLALRPLTNKFSGGKRTPTNADANIGKTCRVISEIQPHRFGRVSLEGVDWTAKSDVVIPVGSLCTVDGIDGVKLLVSPISEEDTAS